MKHFLQMVILFEQKILRLNMNPELKKLKTRWRRFFGQMFRKDRKTWTELLESQWICWAEKVLSRERFPRVSTDLKEKNLRKRLYLYFNHAVDFSNTEELGKLDEIYCREFLLTKRV